MKANELMIGNKVEYFGEVHTIQTVGQWVYTDLTSEEIPLDQCNPIPLTEEWLVRFGFVKNEKHDFRIGLDGDDFIKDQMTLVYKNLIALKIKYVHQLQNLYFALTGEELKLK